MQVQNVHPLRADDNLVPRRITRRRRRPQRLLVLVASSPRSSSRRVFRLCELPRDVPPHVSKTRRRACCALLLSVVVVVVRKTVVVRSTQRRLCRRVVVVLVGGGVLTTVAISVAVAVTFGFADGCCSQESPRRPTERNVVVHISHNQKRGYNRDSYLQKASHRIIIIIIISQIKGNTTNTLLYTNWSRGCCFAKKARSSFLSKKEVSRLGKSSLSLFSVYI